MWTDAKSRELIATEYPWFLNTFDNYSQPIQRADAIRYFVLAHFGGIYIDLDDVCSFSLLQLARNHRISLKVSDTIMNYADWRRWCGYRAATVAWIPSFHTQPGSGGLPQQVSPTTLWGPSHSIPSFLPSPIPFETTTRIGVSLISLSCTALVHFSSPSSGRNTCLRVPTSVTGQEAAGSASS